MLGVVAVKGVRFACKSAFLKPWRYADSGMLDSAVKQREHPEHHSSVECQSHGRHYVLAGFGLDEPMWVTFGA